MVIGVLLYFVLLLRVFSMKNKLKIAILGCTDSDYHDGPRLAHAFNRKGHVVGLFNLGSSPEKTVDQMKEFTPDFCLVTIGRGYDVNTLKQMSEFTKMVHWAYDEYTPEEDSLYKDVKRIFDVTFVKSKGLVPLLEDYCKKVVWTPMYYDPQNDGILIDAPKEGDLIFVGEPHPTQSTIRQKYLEKLSEIYNLNIVGFYWDKFKSNMPKATFLGGYFGAPLTSLVARTKIALNFKNDLLATLELGFSDRALKMMGAGTLMLTHEIEGIEQLFTPGEHLVTYKDYNDLKEKIDFYLTNNGEREQIAKAGQQLVFEKYTIDRVVDIYLEEIRKLSDGVK